MVNLANQAAKLERIRRELVDAALALDTLEAATGDRRAAVAAGRVRAAACDCDAALRAARLPRDR
jgi:hypothetical protein